jgi:TonB family protein
MNTAVARESLVGQVVDGKYELLQWLGSSEHSTVFRTELPWQKQKAAIKLLPVTTQNVEQQISRWRIAATLSHPHLLRIFDAGVCQIMGTQLLYVVMDYAEEDLSQVLPVRPLSAREASEMLRPVLDVLSYLHEKGFVHGRIKPSNVMAVENQIKLSCDHVHKLGDSSDKGPPPSIYDAPEVETGAICPASDVWSVGVMLVTALSQRTENQTRLDTNELGSPESIPEPFREIARGSLRRSPEDRWTLGRIRTTLLPVSLQPVPPVSSRPVSDQPAEVSGRAAKIVTVALVLAVVILAVLLGLRWRSQGKQAVPAQVTAEKEPPAIEVAAPRPPATAPASPVDSGKATAGGSVIERVVPDVPFSARNTIQGKVKVGVRVTVSPVGEVSEATLVSPGPSRYFARIALESSRRWKFKPAEVGGQPVPTAWVLHYRFGRTGTEVDPEAERTVSD